MLRKMDAGLTLEVVLWLYTHHTHTYNTINAMCAIPGRNVKLGNSTLRLAVAGSTGAGQAGSHWVQVLHEDSRHH